jgi:outer membrane protein OmpA-like peptidoglycan-associated protein
VFFDTNKASIQKRSNKLLDQVALALKANPVIQRVRVEGHTDDQGPDERNKRLSHDRAVSVMAYLIRQGIDPARLEALGFGEEVPIADNKKPAGREKNRRVEFTILEQQ